MNIVNIDTIKQHIDDYLCAPSYNQSANQLKQIFLSNFNPESQEELILNIQKSIHPHMAEIEGSPHTWKKEEIFTLFDNVILNSGASAALNSEDAISKISKTIPKEFKKLQTILVDEHNKPLNETIQRLQSQGKFKDYFYILNIRELRGNKTSIPIICGDGFYNRWVNSKQNSIELNGREYSNGLNITKGDMVNIFNQPHIFIGIHTDDDLNKHLFLKTENGNIKTINLDSDIHAGIIQEIADQYKHNRGNTVKIGQP